MPSELYGQWALDPSVTFLNHGSFGACPRAVLEAQTRLRAELEAEPVRFMVRELEGRLDGARAALSAFVGADPAGLAFVRNATEGVNTVLARYPLAPGDAVLTTDHVYAACKNALEELCERTGGQLIVARVPFPIQAPEQVTAAVEAALTPRVRLALIDHITSPTGLVFPVEQLVPRLRARGVEVLIDGAHAPGMVHLDLTKLDPDYYTGNCHKWLCTPKGSAFLWVREEHRARVRPLAFSHGAKSKRTDRSRFHLEHDYSGTFDPTAILCIPVALEVLASLVPGGWPEIRARNHALVCEARKLLLDTIGTPPPAPVSMLGSLATMVLPPAPPGTPPPAQHVDPLGEVLWAEHRIEVPVFAWPAPPARMLRVAAQLYNARQDYEVLARALAPHL